MAKFVIIFLGLVTTFGVAQTKFTKEIQVEDINVKTTIDVKQLYSAYAALLKETPNADVPEILKTFNQVLGADFFIIQENSIEFDTNVFESLVLRNVHAFSQELYPNDYLKQLMIYGTVQKSVQDVKGTLGAIKIPLDQTDGLQKTIQSKDIITDLLTLLQPTLCAVAVQAVATQVNTTITGLEDTLESLNLSSDNAVLLLLVQTILGLVTTLLDYVNSTVTTALTDWCNSIDLT